MALARDRGACLKVHTIWIVFENSTKLGQKKLGLHRNPYIVTDYVSLVAARMFLLKPENKTHERCINQKAENRMINQKAVVFVVDDDEDVCDVLEGLFDSVGLPVKSFTSAMSFLESYEAEQQGCLITDIRMPGMSGMELQKEMLGRNIHLPIVMITGHGDIKTGISAMKAGAFDFVQKPFHNQELLDIVNQAIKKGLSGAERRQKISLSLKRVEGLSKRERQVLDLIVDGTPNKRIADQLNLSDKTIEFHRANIMKKMEARTLADLIKKALAAGDPQDHY